MLLFAVYSSSVRLLSFVEGEKQTEEEITRRKRVQPHGRTTFFRALYGLFSLLLNLFQVVLLVR